MILKQSYSTAWKSPSNIALVKYWGKFGRQYPSNPSISFTLSEAYSNLVMKVNPADSLSCRLEFHGQRETAFEERILRFLESIQDDYPWLEHAAIDMSSTNSNQAKWPDWLQEVLRVRCIPFLLAGEYQRFQTKDPTTMLTMQGITLTPYSATIKTPFLYSLVLPSPYPVVQATALWKATVLPQNDLNKRMKTLSNCFLPCAKGICHHLYEL